MSKPRIIAGTAKGRSLDVPKRGTRPSPARLREALFNAIAFRDKGSFLDLYSGSGAMGLEANSRGWQATCVDLSRGAVRVIQRNAHKLGLEVDILCADALSFAQQHPQQFDVVCAAPPYPLDVEAIFQSILDSQVAHPQGLYIFQYPSHITPELSWLGKPLELKRRAYGSNSLSFIDVDQLSDDSTSS